MAYVQVAVFAMIEANTLAEAEEAYRNGLYHVGYHELRVNRRDEFGNNFIAVYDQDLELVRIESVHISDEQRANLHSCYEQCECKSCDCCDKTCDNHQPIPS